MLGVVHWGGAGLTFCNAAASASADDSMADKKRISDTANTSIVLVVLYLTGAMWK
jgi:hypothetical protein